MRIVVTGKSGQLVTSLIERGETAGHDIVAIGRPEMDLFNCASVASAFASTKPDVIVSAAAYTAVDKAESEVDIAHTVNGEAAGAVARAAKALDVPLIHISTDYVFDGKLRRPYVEADPTGPTGVYGASKLAGERAVTTEYSENSAILRVAWVYSPFGTNFVKTMLRLASDRDVVSIVADQIGNPTNALDIADGILRVASNLAKDEDRKLRGLFHMTANGEANWADFATAIFAASTRLGGPNAMVQRITTEQYPTPALRPSNSRLNSELIAQVHGVHLPYWRTSLDAVVARLIEKGN